MCAFMACRETLSLRTAVCILHDVLQETKSVNYNISHYFNKYIVICDLPYVTNKTGYKIECETFHPAA